MRKIALLATLLLIVPVVSNAQTVEELRAQAQALLLKIQQLQGQLGTTVPGTGVVIDSSACPQIGRVLGIGSSGEDVTRLQQFLARDPSIYPEQTVSGYYGPLTEAAVKRWQARFNIISSGTPATTGYGQVGPRTAAAMSLQCSTYGGGTGGTGVGTVGGFIRVTPISGNAPLTVSVEATVNTVNACTPATYTVEYGDGTVPFSVIVPAGNCRQMVQTFTHIYQNAGTYLVTLSSGAHRTSATVIVSGSTSQPSSGTDSITANPASGAAPLSVSFSGVINGSRSCDGGKYTLEFGDGQSTELPYAAGCQSYSFTISHQYNDSGTFTARLYREPAGTIAASVSVAVHTGSSLGGQDSLSASPTSGTAPLSVSFSGVINGSRSCDGGIYTLVFGDGQSTQLQYTASACQAFSYSVAHQYAGGGTFTAQLYRGTQTGTLAASATITVSGGTSGSYSIVSVTPAAGGNIYAASVQISYPTCSGYSFDWGDGTSPKTVTASGSCSSTSNTTLTHTYTSGGSYTVSLRDGNGILKSTASVVISI